VSNRILRRMAAAGCAVLALAVADVAAQSRSPAPEKPAPRTAGGRPDLSGIWNKPLHLDMAAGIEPLPFTPAGLAAFNNVVNQIDPTSKCVFPGVPRVDLETHPFQIVQLPDKVIFLYEYMHNFRIIPTDGRPHAKDQDSALMGHSVGRWDGDTLVIDSTGFTDRTWLDPHGNVHSDAMHLVERFRRVNEKTLAFEVTVDDPKFYTKAWTVGWTMPLAPADWEIDEYACTDFNKDLEEGHLRPGPLDGSGRDGTANAVPPKRRQ